MLYLTYMEVKEKCELVQCKMFTETYNHDINHGIISSVRAPKRYTCMQPRQNFWWK